MNPFPPKAVIRYCRASWTLAALLLLAFAYPALADETPAIPVETGTASWHYGDSKTASGRRWRPEELIAAHRTLPLGSSVRVTNTRNGLTTTVLITDRGPYTRGRIIDLSPAAAREIDCLNSGTAPVKLEVVRLARFTRVSSVWLEGKR